MEDTHKICKEYRITNYTINDDGSIDVDGEVDLSENGLTELPLIFNKVKGCFFCYGNYLTTLKGSPRWVGAAFNCDDNNLTSLEFSPDYVGTWFSCEKNELVTNYCETEIGSSFFTTLKENGLNLNGINMSNNYNEWRKLYKRKQILNDIFNM